MTRRIVVAKDIAEEEISLRSWSDGDCDIFGMDMDPILNRENQAKLGKALLYHAEHGSLEGLE